ncbi:MAG: ComEC/Rec2 family competence protein, partial [Chitinophagaceae bacterium]
MVNPVYTLWKRAPFLRIVLPLIGGILFRWNSGFSITLNPVTSLFIFTSIILLFILTINVKFLSVTCKIIAIYLLIFFFGAFLSIYHDAGNRSNFAGKLINDHSKIIFRIQEPLVEKPRSWKAIADISEVVNDPHYLKSSGKAILYFQKEDSIAPLHYGDVIIAKNILQPIRNSGNPGEFDYERYCHLKNIFFQGYLTHDSWKMIQADQGNPVKLFFLTCQSWCLRTLSTYISDSRSLGLAQALLAGYRDNMDKDLVQAYANAGVVHIIAISGLHLGLIYLILIFIFKPFSDKGKWRWLKGIVVI